MTTTQSPHDSTSDRFWSSRTTARDFYPGSLAYRERILKNAPPGARVLELGPGTGRDAGLLADAGARVVVVDRSPAALDMIRRSGTAPRAAMLRGDGQQLPFADSTFDLVGHQGLLEHFRNPMPLLAECQCVLKHRGVLVVDVPHTFHPWTLIKQMIPAANRWFAGWETQYTPRQLRRRVQEAGFVVVEAYGDWMRPSLAYRCVRVGFERVGVALPQYPPRWQGGRVERWWLATNVGQLTACNIGVVAQRRRASCSPTGSRSDRVLAHRAPLPPQHAVVRPTPLPQTSRHSTNGPRTQRRGSADQRSNRDAHAARPGSLLRKAILIQDLRLEPSGVPLIHRQDRRTTIDYLTRLAGL